MPIDRIEIDLLKLPYVHFFETSLGRSFDRMFNLIRVYEGGVCGWGECVAEEAPLYSGETAETAWHLMKEFLVPARNAKALADAILKVHFDRNLTARLAGRGREAVLEKYSAEAMARRIIGVYEWRARRKGVKLV